MTYSELIESIYEIIENEKIYKEGLVLNYFLEEEEHKKMDEHLFYKTNKKDNIFTHQDIIEITIKGLIVKILKKNNI